MRISLCKLLIRVNVYICIKLGGIVAWVFGVVKNIKREARLKPRLRTGWLYGVGVLVAVGSIVGVGVASRQF
jgi:hypothetical protein